MMSIDDDANIEGELQNEALIEIYDLGKRLFDSWNYTLCFGHLDAVGITAIADELEQRRIDFKKVELKLRTVAASLEQFSSSAEAGDEST